VSVVSGNTLDTHVKPTLLFVSHKGKMCGVHDYGQIVSDFLAGSEDFNLVRIEPDGVTELEDHIKKLDPAIVVYNFHPDTMPWARDGLPRVSGALHVGIAHEICQEQEHLYLGLFDFVLAPDPTLVAYNPSTINVPRIVAPYAGALPTLEKITVGSFGFNTPSKNFEGVVALANANFDEAKVRLHITKHDFLDPDDTALELLKERCRNEVTKPGIELEFSHDFRDREGILEFLAGNSINVFLYDDTGFRGVSSAVDYALAVDRPIAVSSSSMFRNVLRCNPSICVDKISLSRIIENGTAPLSGLKREYFPKAALQKWESAFGACMEMKELFNGIPDKRGLNKLLDDRSREAYKAQIDELSVLAPETIKRKIPEANIQQAFIVDTVERFAEQRGQAKILAVGSYEDTACEVLRAKGYQLTEIDPGINVDLQDFFISEDGVPDSFDIVLCTSVLEHVDDDEAFVKQIATLIAPGGVGVFTVDFRDSYRVGDDKPNVDHRLYTIADFESRLLPAIPDCRLLGSHTWADGGEDFEFEGSHYSFASFVFEKFPTPQKLFTMGGDKALSTAAWKAFAIELDDVKYRPADTFFDGYERRFSTLKEVLPHFESQIEKAHEESTSANAAAQTALGALQETEEALSNATEEMAANQKLMDALNKELNDAKNENLEKGEFINSLLNSNSWRITRPFRVLVRLLRSGSF
tara:strand:- start:8486 stop:10576 length:2091 start_codon:yes stop_codon:yes gene_type:complete